MAQQPFDLRPAYNAYVSTLANARQQNLTLQEMQGSLQSYQQSLGRQWGVLNDVVQEGGAPEEVAHHLGHYMVDWAIMDALSLIVSKQIWIDPQDQNIQYEFWNKLELQCAWLQSQLWPSSPSPFDEEDKEDDFVELDEAEEDRPAADQDTQQLKPVRLLPQPSTTHPISPRQQVQPDLDLFDELRQAHQDARESLRLAMEANRLTCQAITDLVRPATDLINNASKVQPLPYTPYEVPAKPTHRAMRRITFVVILALIVLALFAFVYFGLQFLY